MRRRRRWAFVSASGIARETEARGKRAVEAAITYVPTPLDSAYAAAGEPVFRIQKLEIRFRVGERRDEAHF